MIPYEDYLDSVRGRLTTFIDGDDLLSISRFDISDPGSFHDARLESIAVGRMGASTHVEARLKGPYYDRYFELLYEGVVSCKIEVPAVEEDLLIHEIRFEDDLIAHELHFARGEIIEIVCARLRFREIRAEIPADE